MANEIILIDTRGVGVNDVQVTCLFIFPAAFVDMDGNPKGQVTRPEVLLGRQYLTGAEEDDILRGVTGATEHAFTISPAPQNDTALGVSLRKEYADRLAAFTNEHQPPAEERPGRRFDA